MHIWPLVEDENNYVFILGVCEKAHNFGALVKDFEIIAVLLVILTCWTLHILNRFKEGLFDDVFEIKFLGDHFTKDLILVIDLKQESYYQKCITNTVSFTIVNNLEEQVKITHRYLLHKVLENLLLLFQSVCSWVRFIIIGNWLD